MKQRNENPEYDNRLAEFTDSVLAGKNGRPESDADDTLRSLEETVLRLSHALPHTEVDTTALKHLGARLRTRMHRRVQQNQLSFWQKWFGWGYGRHWAQRTMTLALLLVVLVIVLITILTPANTSPVTATAFSGSNTLLLLAALAGTVLLVVWFGRRK